MSLPAFGGVSAVYLFIAEYIVEADEEVLCRIPRTVGCSVSTNNWLLWAYPDSEKNRSYFKGREKDL